MRSLLATILAVHCIVSASLVLAARFPSRKSWWAKRITDELYVSGRLTESQIKYAAESGFRTLVSLSVYPSEEAVGEETLPDASGIEDVAELSGMDHAAVLQPGEDWAREETVARFTGLMAGAKTPVLVTSFIGRGAAFVALAYLANRTRADPTYRPRIDSAELYGRATSLGYVYDTPTQTQLVAAITGQPAVANPPRPELAVEDWANNYWLAKPVHKNVYIAGQIRANYLPQIADARYDVVINLRRGVVTPPDKTPSQEEVTLLNVVDRTGTYDGAGRQSEERLLETRLDPDKPNAYVNATAKVNYAARNALEYGDHIGYNETLSRSDIAGKLPEVKYLHTPVGGQYKYGVPLWEAYKDMWLEEAKSERVVLIHCRTAYRSAVAAMLIVGHIEGWNSTQALRKAAEVGYPFQESGATDVITLFVDVLDRKVTSSGRTVLADSALPRLVLVLVALFPLIARIGVFSSLY